MRLLWEDRAWDDYLWWQGQNKKTLKKINALIDIQKSPYAGIGKPEPLKGSLSGLWSRRIDAANRIVYYEQDGRRIDRLERPFGLPLLVEGHRLPLQLHAGGAYAEAKLFRARTDEIIIRP